MCAISDLDRRRNEEQQHHPRQQNRDRRGQPPPPKRRLSYGSMRHADHRRDVYPNIQYQMSPLVYHEMARSTRDSGFDYSTP